MLNRTIVLISLFLGCILASCAFITVNVYFPEKEVKKAFQTLDQKYLGEGGESIPALPESQPTNPSAPSGENPAPQ